MTYIPSRRGQAKRQRRARHTLEALEAKNLLAGDTFAEPDGGWAYVFEGDGAEAGVDPYTALDGTWDHDNGSDAWDGSVIGEGLPGGVTGLADGDTDFVRVQDTGDPRDTLGAEDPSNRKQYFTHLLDSDFNDDNRPDNLDTIVDDGVTLNFRVRVATPATGPLDPLNPDGGTEEAPWPEEGLGYYQHNGGKSLIAIKQVAGPNVAFGLARGSNVNADLFTDADGNSQDGLILPHLLQDGELSDDSDPGGMPETISNETGNVVTVDDVTQWQEFWVTIEAGSVTVNGFEDGTHIVNVYNASGADPLDPSAFGITAATGNDDDSSYIAIGAGATGRAGAFDLDFLAWAPGIHVPALADGGGGGAASPIDLSAGTAAQSSQLGDFVAGNALDDVVNFTHTDASDENPTWQVLLPDSYAFDSVEIFNRQASDGETNCCPSRLRDVTIQVVQFEGDVTTDFTGGEVTSSSGLLNPENTLGGGVDTAGPVSLTDDPGGAVGNLIRVIRTTDPDLSGTGGAGNNDEGSVLSLDLVLAEGTLAEPSALVGDIDGDGSVGFPDFLILSASFGTDVDPGTMGDLDGDGSVGFPDFLILSANFGQTAAAAIDAAFARGDL